MKYAIVEKGVVVNIVKSEADFASENGWILATENAQIGGTYENGVFSPRIREDNRTAEQKAADIREDRNGRLASCDWTQVSDVSLSDDQKAEWASYRQALRDVTSQDGFPDEVVWPTMP